MSTGKLLREFRRKAKLAGYQVREITSAAGHLHATVLHGTALQRLTLPSSPSCVEHSIKYALDEIRRFRTAHETSAQQELHLHGSSRGQDAAAQTDSQPAGRQAHRAAFRRPTRRCPSAP